MTSTTSAPDSPAPALVRWAKSALTKGFAKLIAAAFSAGLAAGAGFWTMWQGLDAKVSAHGRQIEALEHVQGSQSEALADLQRRQAEDEATHREMKVESDERSKAILDNLKNLREDFRDLRRDLTGRMTP